MPLRFRILAAPAGDPGVTTTAALPPTGARLGPRVETRFEAPSDPGELIVGRRADVAVSLPFASVSARHARLFRGDTEREWWIEDLGSVNGTWVDETRAAPGQPVPLRAGQRLRVGTIELLFDGWSSQAGADEGTGTLARRLISDLFSSPEGEVPTLAVASGPVRVAPLRLVRRDRRYLAGRADACDLRLPSEHVSREHAAFMRRREGVFVEDLGSRNTVRVNGAAITGATRLSDGDRIEVGAVVLSLVDPEDRYRARLERLEGPGPAEAGAARGRERSGTPTVGWPVAPSAPPSEDSPPRAAPGPGGSAGRTVALIAVGGVVVLAVAGLIVLLVTSG
ncbi:MAG TPA: FHA domain-containing protein [Polyangia bacterium]|nr:FHA domain-containing protein [Polyangia bacterium]